MMALRYAAQVAVLIFASAVAGVTALPHPDMRYARSDSSAASSGSAAFSSAGTAILPGPDGAGSFTARADMGRSNNQFPGFGFGGGGGSFNGGGGSFSGAGGYSGGGAYGGSFAGPIFPGGGPGAGAGAGAGGFGDFPPFPYMAFPAPYQYQPFDFSAFLQQYLTSLQQYHQKLAAAAQQAAASKHGGVPSPTLPDGSNNEVGGVGAAAVGQYSPQGGYGAAGVFPAPNDGIDVRFGGASEGADKAPPSNSGSGPVSSVSGSFPPPGGSFHGISTFSASGQSDINGKKTSYKQSSVSVNDNGKVTTYTAHDP